MAKDRVRNRVKDKHAQEKDHGSREDGLRVARKMIGMVTQCHALLQQKVGRRLRQRVLRSISRFQ